MGALILAFNFLLYCAASSFVPIRFPSGSSSTRAGSTIRLDVLLLSLCDVFIGKHTSNVFRTAYELHASRCNCAPPFVSLDAPWCFDWGVWSGYSPGGKGWFPC